jgi:hypothetical protein
MCLAEVGRNTFENLDDVALLNKAHFRNVDDYWSACEQGLIPRLTEEPLNSMLAESKFKTSKWGVPVCEVSCASIVHVG